MRLKTICATVALGLMSGCTTQTERLSWDIKPVLNVRHGMANATAYYQLGRYYQGQKRIAEAEKAFEQAVAADGGHVDALNALGALYAERGDLQGALGTFKRVEALAPNLAYLSNNLGYALFLQGRHREAIVEIRRALVLDPNYERAWINLEKIAGANGDTLLAEQANRRRLGPELLAENLRSDGLQSPNEPPANHESGAPLVASRELSAVAPSGARKELAAVVETVTDVIHADRLPSSFEVSAVTPAVLRTIDPQTDAVVEKVTMRSDSAPGSAALERIRTMTLQLPTPGAPSGKAFRLEVSNGNGLRFLAKQFGVMLKQLGQPVVRITNRKPFDVQHTVIEYRAGFVEAAGSVNERFRLGATLREAGEDRPGTDIRLILGRDIQIPAAAKV